MNHFLIIAYQKLKYGIHFYIISLIFFSKEDYREKYYPNVSCTLNLISMFIFLEFELHS